MVVLGRWRCRGSGRRPSALCLKVLNCRAFLPPRDFPDGSRGDIPGARSLVVVTQLGEHSHTVAYSFCEPAILSDTPLENVLRALWAASHWGSYPLDLGGLAAP